MGGRNHQPCRIYLQNSTRLSRALSCAYRELEHANVCLEDVILAELAGAKGQIGPIIEHLNTSEAYLAGALSNVEALRVQMQEEGYEELPSLRWVDLGQLGQKLIEEDLTEKQAWRRIQRYMKDGGFYRVLDHFEVLINNLVGYTHDVTDKIALLDAAAKQGLVERILEENHPGNIKREFARLFTIWAMLHQDFLASSMLSTELWYAFTDKGSLIEHKARADAA